MDLEDVLTLQQMFNSDRNDDVLEDGDDSLVEEAHRVRQGVKDMKTAIVHTANG